QQLAIQALGHKNRRFGLAAMQDGKSGKTQFPQALCCRNDGRMLAGEKLRAREKLSLNRRAAQFDGRRALGGCPVPDALSQSLPWPAQMSQNFLCRCG